MSQKKFSGKSPLITVGIIVIAAIALFFVSSSIGSNEKSIGTNQSSSSGRDNKLASQSSGYQEYSPEAVSAAAARDKIVLNFHAPWCPTCVGLDRDITAHLSEIPDNVLILKTDFDSQTTLKQKYDVRIQHTLVQINREGEKIASWTLSPTLDDLLSQLE